MKHKVVINKFQYGYFNISTEAIKWLKNKYNLDETRVYTLSRHDPKLVECVEQLGYRASGSNAILEVTELKEGNMYRILRNEGYEYVTTPTDNKWIKIEENDISS